MKSLAEVSKEFKLLVAALNAIGAERPAAMFQPGMYGPHQEWRVAIGVYQPFTVCAHFDVGELMLLGDMLRISSMRAGSRCPKKVTILEAAELVEMFGPSIYTFTIKI